MDDQIVIVNGPAEGKIVSTKLGQRWPWVLWWSRREFVVVWYTLHDDGYKTNGKIENLAR